MTSNRRNRMTRAVFIVTSLGLLSTLGCGKGGPKLYPIKGKVELAAGEVKHLAGSNIEAKLESDPTVRASGTLGDDGSFTLETLREGVIRKGAIEGTYLVRFILPDDDKEARRQAAKALDPRFLKFESSGLSLQVPATGEVTLKVSPK